MYLPGPGHTVGAQKLRLGGPISQFNIYFFLPLSKLFNGEPVGRREVGVAIQVNSRGTRGLNINTLVVILCYSLARCYHWGKPNKGTLCLSVLFLTTSWESTITSK